MILVTQDSFDLSVDSNSYAKQRIDFPSEIKNYPEGVVELVVILYNFDL
ncbi:hypothetical protein [Roseivirga sp.]